ncbi:MAG: ABC transporter substrate-binding protein, partial [Spirochaetia bacterium]|nr:ABC transporter substrate-binding protein [Spirochaetia bacterium]
MPISFFWSIGVKKLFLITTIMLTLSSSLFSMGKGEVNIVKDSSYTDSRGIVIPLNGELKRIISLSPNVSEIIASLGATDMLVGRTDYCTYPPSIQNVVTVGDLMSPSIEKIVSLNPDIVIVSTLGQNQTLQTLSQQGLTVAYIDKSQSMEGTYSLIEDIALLVGKKEEGAILISAMKDEVKKVEERVSSLTPRTTYYVAGFGQWGDFTATGDTFINEMIQIAGGENIASSARNWTFSLEELLMHDPEVIILPPLWNS